MWAAAFIVGMFGTGGLARLAHLNAFWSMAVMLPPMLLLIPMVKTAERAQAAGGCGSAAVKSYNRRMLVCSFAYVAALFGAIAATNGLRPQGALAWMLAILPSLPILAMLWSMARYLVEESDEYMRLKAVNAALSATGLLLCVATFWGFLETFGLVVHQPSWWAVPIWAIGLGLGRVVDRARS
jgi:hypothetical protein